MRFMYEGSEYEILFNRDFKQVEIIDRKKNEKRTETSKFPATIAMILKVDHNKKSQFWDVIASSEVTCYTHDRFDIEQGRMWALKKLTHLIPSDMRPIMWETYKNRPRAGNLKEQNRELRKEVNILKTLAEKLERERNQWQDSYHKMLNERGGEHDR